MRLNSVLGKRTALGVHFACEADLPWAYPPYWSPAGRGMQVKDVDVVSDNSAGTSADRGAADHRDSPRAHRSVSVFSGDLQSPRLTGSSERVQQ